MPIYEYLCDACGHELEAIQKMSDDPLAVCPRCGSNQIKRLMSSSGFRLKGGGWYETDFKKDKQRNLTDDKADKKNDTSALKTDTPPAIESKTE
jgi:putative FmdB family regulatory protein